MFGKKKMDDEERFFSDEEINEGNDTEESRVEVSSEQPGEMQLKLMRPESHTDAPEIADKLMAGSIVVLNIDSLEKDSAIRLIDFLAGVIHVLGANMKKANNKTIVLAPAGVNISDLVNSQRTTVQPTSSSEEA